MKINKIFALFLGVLLAVTAFPITSFAWETDIDLSVKPSLKIEFKDGETALSGAEFDVFFVAKVDKFGNYLPQMEFLSFDIAKASRTQEGWRELSQSIEGYVYKEGIEPFFSGKTDSEGVLPVPETICGLYLIVGKPHSQGDYIYQAETAIVQLPCAKAETNEWNYDITVKPKYSFEPKEEEETFITRKVLKIWDDKGFENKRPKEIKVYLICDGKVFETVKLNKENNWRYTWNKLEKGHKWTVTEELVPGYSLKVKKEGITFVLTNSYNEKPPVPDIPDVPGVPEKPSVPNLPQTGQLWWPVPVLSGAGILFVGAGILRKRGSKK